MGDGHDSAGLPGSGRELTGTGFDGDDGTSDARLAAALSDPGAETALMAAVRGARLLVAIVAAPTEVGETDGLAVEKSTDMAVVTMTAPDGRRGLPVFSSIATLQAWDAAARPVPVTSARAGQAAVQERCEVMLLDLGTETSVVLRASMVWALAADREWVPAHQDPFVTEALERAVAHEPDVVEVLGQAGEPADAGILRVVLRLRAGLDAPAVESLATRVGERIATDGETRARIDGLSFSIQQA